MSNQDVKIKITEAGPYLVSGHVPLYEKIIVPKGREYEFENGRELPQAEAYALCRCGHSKNAPFCDGSHETCGFVGKETASRDRFHERAELLEGPGIDLMDDNRCAYARFCHRKHGNVWELTEDSINAENIKEAIKAASDCPAGRLVAREKNGNLIEPSYGPEIDIIQDPQQGVSSGIFIKGNIPVVAADGFCYETRNRAMLCRCGGSRNLPYCDASHIPIKFIAEP